MIKAKTLKNSIYCLFVISLFSSISYAGLIKPLPKPQEFSLQKKIAPTLKQNKTVKKNVIKKVKPKKVCLLYTSPSPRDRTRSRMPSSA